MHYGTASNFSYLKNIFFISQILDFLADDIYGLKKILQIYTASNFAYFENKNIFFQISHFYTRSLLNHVKDKSIYK